MVGATSEDPSKVLDSGWVFGGVDCVIAKKKSRGIRLHLKFVFHIISYDYMYVWPGVLRLVDEL